MPSKLAILCMGAVVLGSVGCKGAFVERNVYNTDIAQLKDYIGALERDNAEMSHKVAQFDRLKAQFDINGNADRNLDSLAESLKKALAGMGIPTADAIVFNEKKGSFDIHSDVLFSSGSYSISSKGKQILGALAGQLGGRKLKIVGHTDRQPVASPRTRKILDTDTNLELSVKRANAVMGELLHGGIAEADMFVVGRGSTMPLGGANKRDRRVEIFIAAETDVTTSLK